MNASRLKGQAALHDRAVIEAATGWHVDIAVDSTAADFAEAAQESTRLLARASPDLRSRHASQAALVTALLQAGLYNYGHNPWRRHHSPVPITGGGLAVSLRPS